MLAIRSTFIAVLMLALTSCAIFSPSPESQILTSANSITAGANLTTAKLRSKSISVDQAKNYRDTMRLAEAMLKDANVALVACRKATNSKPETTPDPCKKNIALDIQLATTILAEVEATLRAKE